MIPYAYHMGRRVALVRLGLTKMAAVPPQVLKAVQSTGSYLKPGRSFSIMGGEGGALSKDLMARMSGKSVPGYEQRFTTEADKLWEARHLLGKGAPRAPSVPALQTGPVPTGTVASSPAAKRQTPLPVS